MKLDITAALRSPGTEIPFEHQETLLDQDIVGETVQFKEPVRIKGNYSMVNDTLYIKGRLNTTAYAACARCLAPVTYRVDVPVEESFTRVKPGTEPEDDPWEEQLTFSGSGVEMGHLAQTLTVLDLPIRFLCGDACPGMPANNQDNSNQQEDMPDRAHPFSALSQLKTNDQEE